MSQVFALPGGKIDSDLLMSLMGDKEDDTLGDRLQAVVAERLPPPVSIIADRPVKATCILADAPLVGGSLYPKLPPLPNFVPTSQVPALVAPTAKKEYAPKSYLTWVLSKPIYHEALTTLTASISGDRGTDKRVITGYVQTVRTFLSGEASLESRLALFEEAINSAVYYCNRRYKKDFEDELRSQYYGSIIDEEAAKVRSIFQPERKEENPDTVLSPLYRHVRAIEQLRGASCNPIREIYSKAFGSYVELFTPLRQLHDAYQAVGEGQMKQVYKNRWQQLAQVFSVLFDTPRILKPEFALGEPLLIQNAFIVKK
jgi:hypothetical protein